MGRCFVAALLHADYYDHVHYVYVHVFPGFGMTIPPTLL